MPTRRATVARIVLTLVVWAGVSRPSEAQDQPVRRVYFVGNSVTDTVRYPALAATANDLGVTLIYGRHMIPGAPLSWIWEHPRDGFREERSGYYPEALSKQGWDVLSLQPFDRLLDGEDGDLATARKFIEFARKKSPAVRVYLYSRWPRRDESSDGSRHLDYRAKWLRNYTGGWDGTNETRDYFERLLAALRRADPGAGPPALLVPVGDVLLELDGRMKSGKVPGSRGVEEFYADGIHLNNVGSFVVGTTFLATLLKKDPRGTSPAHYAPRPDAKTDRPIPEELATAVQDAVWAVVRVHPLAGVAPAEAAPDAEEGFIPLFNGKDLSGWRVKGGEDLDGKTASSDGRFVAVDGVIRIEGANPIRDLYTTREFNTPFVLRLEFRAQPRANSGLHLRGKQLQVRDYPTIGPYKDLKRFKPGDWNAIEVTVTPGNDGRPATARCTCNGELLEASLELPERGGIGLQSETNRIEYRNLRLTPTP